MLLYIHIPFCNSKCFYCSFNSFTKFHNLKDNYIDAVLKQFEFEKERFQISKNQKIETLFLGGGTPSTLNNQQLEKLLTPILDFVKKDAEITIEANPNTVSLNWLKNIFKLGINRISFGVQSFNDQKLKFLGRTHNFEIAMRSILEAKEAGFKNINLDLIYNTILDDEKLIFKDLEIIEKLDISHLSLYSLTIEENSKFQNRDDFVKEDIDLTKKIFQKVEEIGFLQYEISNFGKISKHNLGYWQGKNYIGLGAGAVGFLKNQRFYPEKDIKKYIQNPLKHEIEQLSKDDLKLEKLFLGFRSIVGVKAQILNSQELKKAKILENEGILTFKNDTFFNQNFLLADEVFCYTSC